MVHPLLLLVTFTELIRGESRDTTRRTIAPSHCPKIERDEPGRWGHRAAGVIKVAYAAAWVSARWPVARSGTTRPFWHYSLAVLMLTSMLLLHAMCYRADKYRPACLPVFQVVSDLLVLLLPTSGRRGVPQRIKTTTGTSRTRWWWARPPVIHITLLLLLLLACLFPLSFRCLTEYYHLSDQSTQTDTSNRNRPGGAEERHDFRQSSGTSQLPNTALPLQNFAAVGCCCVPGPGVSPTRPSLFISLCPSLSLFLSLYTTNTHTQTHTRNILTNHGAAELSANEIRLVRAKRLYSLSLDHV